MRLVISKVPSGWGDRIARTYTLYTGNRELTVGWSNPKNIWGRFGGGWQWKLGVQFTNPVEDIIFSLVFFTVRIQRVEERTNG